MQCRKLLMDHRDMIPFQQLKEKRHTQCQNIESLGGYHISQYQTVIPLKQNDKTYCLVPAQVDVIGSERNPYTGRLLTHKLPSFQKTRKAPLSQYTRMDHCPVQQLGPKTPSSSFVILETLSPLRQKDIPNDLNVSSHTAGEQPKAPVRVFFTFNPFNKIYSKYYYVAELYTPMAFYHKLKPTNIRRVYEIFHRDEVQQTQKISPSLTTLVKTQLKDFFLYRRHTFSKSVLKTLNSLHIKLKKKIKVYRGLFFPNTQALESSNYLLVKQGDTVVLKGGREMSWTTDPCVAQYFAIKEGARVHTYKKTFRYGILLSTTLSPDNVLLDTRLIDTQFFLTTLYFRQQQEIISQPSVEAFVCQVERLYISNGTRAFPVKTFEKFLAL